MSATSRSDTDQPVIEDVGAPVPPAHNRPTFWTVRRVRSLALAAIILAVAVSLLSAYVAAGVAERARVEQQRTEERLVQLEKHVADKGQERDADTERLDADTERLDQRVDTAVCDFLDFLAPSMTTDRIRAAYECGPHPNPAAPTLVPGGLP